MSQHLSDQLPGGRAALERTQARVVGADKTALTVLGTRKVQIKLGRHETTEECIVVASLNAGFILGLTAQKKLRLSIHPAEQCVSIGPDTFPTGSSERKRAIVQTVELNHIEDLQKGQQRQLEEQQNLAHQKAAAQQQAKQYNT